MYKFFTLILVTLFGLQVSGKGKDDFEQIKQKYARYNAVITEHKESYLFDIVDDSVRVSQQVEQQMLILNEYSKEFTKDVIHYSAFSRLENYEAYSLIPEGGKYKKIAVDNFQESNNMDESIFFDDSKKISFSYPSLQQGAKTALNYELCYLDPHFLRHVFLQSFIPMLHTKVTLKIHRDIDVGYQLKNGDGFEVKVNQYSKGKYNYIEFETRDIDRLKYYSGGYYSLRSSCPHLLIYLKEARLSDHTEQYFGTVKDLYRFSHQYVTEANQNEDTELTKLVHQLTDGLDDAGKARQIYYWVQDNIKYIAYSAGYDGFRPMEATEVFKKRFGDCKGMSSLIRKMMHLAGLDARFTWVGTRHIPYQYSETALPSTDNHMIVSYFDHDSLVVLDGTFKYLDYGIVPYHIQGKEIMIEENDTTCLIRKLPIAQASYSVTRDSLCIQLNGDVLNGHAWHSQTGFNKVQLAHAMDGVKQDDYSKRFSRLFQKGNNKFKVDSFHVRNLFQHDQPAELDYYFTLEDYCKKFGDEIYVNLNLEKAYENLVVDTSGIISPIENDFYCLEEYITSFEIPDGYTVSYMPDNSDYQTEQFGFNIKYERQGNTILLKNSIRLEFFVLLDDNIEAWNRMVKALNKQYRATVVLKKI